jgi:uncharacterized protein
MALMGLPNSLQAQAPAPQPASSPPVLEIQGTGRMKVQPDQTTVMVQVQSTNSEAGRAVQLVTEQVEQLLKKLQDAGFKKEEIKTSQFYMHEDNEWLGGRMIRKGYVARQTLEVKFGLDPKRMTRLTNAFAKTPEGVTFQFGFGMSDKLQQEVKEELIRRAIQDARQKGEVIARAASIRLGSIRKIEYGRQGFQPYEQAQMRTGMMMDKQEASFPQTEIQDLELTDQIMVVWTLEQ